MLSLSLSIAIEYPFHQSAAKEDLSTRLIMPIAAHCPTQVGSSDGESGK